MKKIILSLTLPIFLLSTLSAQITQEQADIIVLKHLNNEAKPYILYAKDTLQTEGISITTSTDEALELNYACWAFYIKYNEGTNGKYLTVTKSKGNILEVNTKKDEGPEDLDKWRILIINIHFEVVSLAETTCQWKKFQGNIDNSELITINSTEKLEENIECTEEYDYPEIDFSKHTLLLVRGVYQHVVNPYCEHFQQLATQNYLLIINLRTTPLTAVTYWQVPIIVNKIDESAVIELIIKKYSP